MQFAHANHVHSEAAGQSISSAGLTAIIIGAIVLVLAIVGMAVYSSSKARNAKQPVASETTDE
jgi:uncharacterized protein HemX